MEPETRTCLTGLPTLVVDDNPDCAYLLEHLLTNAGCQVRRAGDAEEAFVVLRTFPARLVLLDLVLPCMGGLMLARHLKRESVSTNPDLVILAISCMDEATARPMALSAGCAGFIAKPIDPPTFVATVARHFDAVTSAA